MSNEASGSETLGSTGDRTKMTLFKDDRQEDWGAIVFSILVVAVVVVMTL
jgi:hypothetical protein